jgi:hypothetical protein
MDTPSIAAILGGLDGEEIEIVCDCQGLVLTVRIRLTVNRITVCSLQQPTMTVTNALNRSFCGGEVKTTTASDCDPANVHAFLFAIRHNRLDPVASPKALNYAARFC